MFTNRANLQTLPTAEVFEDEYATVFLTDMSFREGMDYAWTNTRTGGSIKHSSPCHDWSSSDDSYGSAQCGYPAGGENSWSDAPNDAQCYSQHNLICFEQ